MKAVILFSGGLDSLAAAALAREAQRDLLLLHIQHGQRQARAEVQAAGALASALGAPLRIVDFEAMRAIRAEGKIIPGRNLMFLALATAYAHGVGAGEVWIGACGADAVDFPDCRPGFLDAAEAAVRAGGVPVAVVSPLVATSKTETFGILRDAGLLDQALETTHTCYEGNHHDRHAWGFGCGACAACTTRAAGWAAFTG